MALTRVCKHQTGLHSANRSVAPGLGRTPLLVFKPVKPAPVHGYGEADAAGEGTEAVANVVALDKTKVVSHSGRVIDDLIFI